MSSQNTPAKQRALVLQGGGALGAYDAGVFQAIYEKLINGREDENKPLFDIVAGTSSGAMNSAILVSHVVQNNNRWKGSADKLNDFWNYVSRDLGNEKIGIMQSQGIPGIGNWWEYWHNVNPNVASEEAARRYYSAKEFLYTGVPRVFYPLLPPRMDTRFFDNASIPNNIWYVYSNQPLKDSLEKFAKFPIKTSFEEDQKQPRLLLVSVDVLEGAVVTFDSYPKVDGSRNSQYSPIQVDGSDGSNGGGGRRGNGKDDEVQYEYTIPYNSGIISDYAIASGSVPINYDYARLWANKLTIDDQGNKRIDQVQQYFWDGGIASNTPLRELIQAHKDYWLDVKGKGKDDALIPDLDVYIVDVWPTKEANIPMDHDGVEDRNYDLLLCDKTDYDETVANIVSDYVNLSKKLIELAKDKGASKDDINNILSNPKKGEIKSKHRNGQPRTTYLDLIKGRFNVDVKRIERKRNTDNDISNKLLDFSTDTIKQLMDDGYNDALNSEALKLV